MFQVGDTVTIDNLNGKINTHQVGANGNYTIHTGDLGIVIEITNNEAYNINVKMEDGKRLSFKESELKIKQNIKGYMI